MGTLKNVDVGTLKKVKIFGAMRAHRDVLWACISSCDTTYLNVTTLDKKVEKSVGQVGGKGTHHPRVEESYVGDLGRQKRVKKGNLLTINAALRKAVITQNIAKTRLQRKRAKLVDGWIGGRRSSWFTWKIFTSRITDSNSPVLSNCSCPGAI